VTQAAEAEAEPRTGKSVAAFRTTGEAAEELDVPAHVLRFWESKFTQIRPLKRGGGRRYYRPEDIDLLRRIRQYLYREGYTIRGVQRLLHDGTGHRRPPAPGDERPSPPSVPAPSREAARAALEAVADELREIRRILGTIGDMGRNGG
jgi:DNA-binding transcriptional MerR regulator